MYNKIDNAIWEKIHSQNLNMDEINVIVYSNEYNKTYLELKNIIEENNIVGLPFISSFAVNTKRNALIKIANYGSVDYISDDAKVCNLIYDSKKFIHLEKLETSKLGFHSCCIIDTGVYPHIDFCLGKNRIVKFVDLVNSREDMYDDNGHGTFVAGILGANSIIDKYNGIDDKSNIIVIKALDSDGETTTTTILKAMQWILDNRVKYNIKVVCMSFGGAYKENDPLSYGANILWDYGIVVVAAAGNSGPESNTIMSPGISRKIITVGSLDKIDKGIRVAKFSSRGPVLNIYKPDMVLPGVDITSNNVFSKDKRFYTSMSGTSVSTPMVAGVVSLLYSINPNYSPTEIKYMLINSCVKIKGDRNSEGFGYLDLRKLILI